MIGYVVLAKRPTYRGEDYPFNYEAVGGVHPDVEPCENHQAYCTDMAERDPERHGQVEYVIAEVQLWAGEQQ